MSIKRENYINIQGWMITDLMLKGNDLLIYAIIYGFTQDGEQWFKGSRQYLADWCNSTKKGISKNLDSLTKKGYIIKEEQLINNVKFCKYKANLEKLTLGNKVPHPGEQSSPPPREQSSPNNIDIYNLYNNNNNNKVEKIKNLSPEIITSKINTLHECERVKELIRHIIINRVNKNHPITSEVFRLLIERLNKLSNGEEEKKIALLEETVLRGYDTIYLPINYKIKSKTKKESKDPLEEVINQLVDKQSLSNAIQAEVLSEKSTKEIKSSNNQEPLYKNYDYLFDDDGNLSL